MRRLALASIVTAALVITSCALPRPPGDGNLRYRDPIFSNVTVTNDVIYGNAPDSQGNNVDLKLDLYQPAGDTVTKRPALVWVHGGGFTAGDKASGRAKATAFAKLGYVAVSINYRLLSPDGCGGNPNPTPVCQNAALAAQHDAQAAVRFLRKNAALYKVDADRIAMGGASAGGVTSVLAATRREDPGHQRQPGLLVDHPGSDLPVRGHADRRVHRPQRHAHDLLPRHGGHDGPVPVGGAERGRDVQRRRLHGALPVRGRRARARRRVRTSDAGAVDLLPVLRDELERRCTLTPGGNGGRPREGAAAGAPFAESPAG